MCSQHVLSVTIAERKGQAKNIKTGKKILFFDHNRRSPCYVRYEASHSPNGTILVLTQCFTLVTELAYCIQDFMFGGK